MTRAKKRLEREYESFVTSPFDYIKVNFEKGAFLEWHFLFMGQIGTPFEVGEYHGTLVFPDNYPFSPPSTRFITPNGRFQTNERICFSISDFHPENWKPAYTMSAFLQGVYSFMMTETTDTVGSLVIAEEEIRKLAKMSKEFNKSDEAYNKMFREKIDETIESSLNISPASNKGEHTSWEEAKFCHQLNTVNSLSDDFETLSTDYTIDNVSGIKDKSLQRLNRVPTPNRILPTQYYSKHKPTEQLLHVHITDFSEKLEHTEQAVKNFIFNGQKKVEKIFSNCIKHTFEIELTANKMVTHTPVNPYVNTFGQLFSCVKKVKNKRIHTSNISFKGLYLEESRSTKNSTTTDKLVTRPRIRSKSVPVQTFYHAMNSNNCRKISFVKSLSMESLNKSNITDKCFNHPLKRCKNIPLLTSVNGARENYNKITSLPSKILKEFPLEISQSSENNATDKWSFNLPKRSENVQIPKTSYAPNSPTHDQNGITSVASDSSKEFSLRKSQPNLSYATYKYSAYIPKRSEYVVNASELNTQNSAENLINISDHSPSDIAEKQSKTSLTRSSLMTSQRNQNMKNESVIHQPHPTGKFKDDLIRNSFRSPKFRGNQSGIISTASNATNKFSSKIPRPNRNKTTDKCVANPPRKFENNPKPKFDCAHKSLVGSNEGEITTNPIDFLKGFHSQISLPDHGSTVDKVRIHLPRNSESSTLHEFDRTYHSLIDKNPHSNNTNEVLSSLPSTFIQEIHYENPDTLQKFTTSDKIVPRNTNSKFQDSNISISTKIYHFKIQLSKKLLNFLGPIYPFLQLKIKILKIMLKASIIILPILLLEMDYHKAQEMTNQ